MYQTQTALAQEVQEVCERRAALVSAAQPLASWYLGHSHAEHIYAGLDYLDDDNARHAEHIYAGLDYLDDDNAHSLEDF
jgi:hypothetical protein